ncbi:MAG: extracellular solute-binding protein [Planctomycetota bacterium]
MNAGVTTNKRVLRGMTWDHPRGYDPMVAASARYAKEQPGVELVWEKRSLSEFEERSVEELAEAFDLMVIDHPHMGDVAASGCLAPFTDSPPLAEVAAGSVGRSFESYRYDGRQWALPIDAAAQVSAWREGFLDAPPADWEQCIELAGQARVVWPLHPVHALMSFYTLCAGRGTPCAADAELFVTESDGLAVLDALAVMVARVPSACFGMDPIQALELIGTGKADFAPHTYGYISYSRAGFLAHRVRFGEVPVLSGTGAVERVGSALGGTGIAVSARSAHVELAQDFALRVAGSGWQRGLFFEAGGQPGHADAWEDDTTNAETLDFFRGTRATLEQAYLRPRFPGYVRFQRAAGEQIATALRGEQTHATAIGAINALYASATKGGGS